MSEYEAADSEISDCKENVERKKAEVSAKEAQVKDAEKAPPPFIQPLPAGGGLALQWIFFLHMPPSSATCRGRRSLPNRC